MIFWQIRFSAENFCRQDVFFFMHFVGNTFDADVLASFFWRYEVLARRIYSAEKYLHLVVLTQLYFFGSESKENVELYFKLILK